MQFVPNGPDIPEAVLEAHEEGRVIFFCGAGISYPADLPGFKGLVDQIYQIVGTVKSDAEQEAYERKQYDATLDLLERRLPGQRMAVRTALASALQPNLRRRGATKTHDALLHLGRSPEGALRLVTTNFDRIFERVGRRKEHEAKSYVAPMLPVPKSSRWDGIVYLHGLLPAKPSEEALNRLVVTSGDFGLAYLTERWAARFVTELFRNYMVCFVGYSINDPVLRYMMDALAADRMLGEATPQAYALGDCVRGQEQAKTVEWEAKGVTPILYQVPSGAPDHSILHRTLVAWSDTYRNGVLGKERIVIAHALARPAASTTQDDFVGRMLWAVSHTSGLPAKRFADFDPVPPIEWLPALCADRFGHSDLTRFGVSPRPPSDDGLRFSLVRRPAPYRLAPRMALVSGGAARCEWDDVMFQIGRWLVRHLDDPELVMWLAEQGGQIHERFAVLIEGELDRIGALERGGNVAELARIRTNAPNAIPRKAMRTLWRLFLTGRVKAKWDRPDLHLWGQRFRRDGLTAALRLELREMLAPKILMKRPFRWPDDSAEKDDGSDRIKELVDWELVLAADHVHSFLGDVSESEVWGPALSQLVGEFETLLRDALDLLREMGEADDWRDRSHWELPSISAHWQNRGFHDWVALIELLRDAWLAKRKQEPTQGTSIARAWFELPYPTFKRLALYAATKDETIKAEEWVEWVLSGASWWLWCPDTQREVMRLLVLRGRALEKRSRLRIERAILSGPPRSMYRSDLDAKTWRDTRDYCVWLRITKLKASRARLSARSTKRLAKLSAAHPQWRVSSNESEEFTHWMTGSGDPDYEELREVDTAPRKRKELVKWLNKTALIQRGPWYEDTWGEICGSRFFLALSALLDLSRKGRWPADRWREALQAWSNERQARRSWRFAAPLIQKMPDSTVADVAHSLSWWMQEVAKVADQNDPNIISVSARLLRLSAEGVSELDDPVTRAINQPVGQVTQALLTLWFRRKPNDNDGLPPDIKPIFTEMCNTERTSFQYGRVILASRVIALFRVDRSWTEEFLLPLFDWNANSQQARIVWEGFLWSPRIYKELLIAIKASFLDTASHYSELREHKRQFAAFLTYAGLEPIDGYSPSDFRIAVSRLPQDGLQEVAQALSQALEGAGDRREVYWSSRIAPFLHGVWPKSKQLASNPIAESLARLSIAAGNEFPSALAVVLPWLGPLEHGHYIIHLLRESKLPQRFPRESLRLLDRIVHEHAWTGRDLIQCLVDAVNAQPALRRNRSYQRLDEIARRRGG
jgi:hypothetical protein